MPKVLGGFRWKEEDKSQYFENIFFLLIRIPYESLPEFLIANVVEPCAGVISRATLDPFFLATGIISL